jgi:hypothetical protein
MRQIRISPPQVPRIFDILLISCAQAYYKLILEKKIIPDHWLFGCINREYTYDHHDAMAAVKNQKSRLFSCNPNII